MAGSATERKRAMAITTVFFDLDGTLTDPKVGITRGIRHALQKFGIEADPEALTHFIGPPLRAAFMQYYGMDTARAEIAIAGYREYYAVTGLYECLLYPGIAELLERLRATGKRLVVATSKPTVYAVSILEHYGIARCFEHICGCELDGTRDTKSEVVAYAMQMAAVAPAEVVMVGDREHDVYGAGEHGIACVGVTYGYGGREELAAAGAAHIVDTVGELESLLLTL